MPSRGENKNQLNKNYFKSIYFNYILGDNVGEDRNNLNSREKIMLLSKINEELNSLQKTKYIDERYDTATFEYRNESTGLKILHKINMLTSIKDKDVLLWSYTFKELARIFNWNTNSHLEVLRQVVCMNIQLQIGPPSNVNDYIKLIIKQKYNNDTVHR
ncbi:hypothetical protein DMUE_1439 [Dictyocoela muelleri]|nr:hypothetical protein DMUE_1439 [Dictyocoela muelleri]